MGLLKDCKSLFGNCNLYDVLSVSKSATNSELKKAYYKVSLEVHPDRVKENDKEIATKKFQTLGQVYSILSNEENRAVYDETGEVDEELMFPEGKKDWYENWRLIFKKISVADIERFKKDYNGSEEELEDLKRAYNDGKGDMDFILQNVLCASVEDEERFENIIQKWIKKHEVEPFAKSPAKNIKATARRKRKAASEAVEAEEMRQKLGLNDTEDSLQQLIMKRNMDREKSMDAFLDNLGAKYGAKPKATKKKTTKNK